MSRNGAGVYSLPAGNPVTTGTAISSTVQNNTTADIATALTASIAYDGQTTPIANLPMGGYKHTNVANASNATDYAAYGQVLPLTGGTVTGATTFSSTLAVTGAATLSSTLAVTGNETVGGTLGVTGASTLASLAVTGNETVGGTLGVTGNSTFTGTITPSQTNGIVGTTTNNAANAGSVGELITSSVAKASPVALTTATTKNITSISLTAGDWDVFGQVMVTGTSTTNFNTLQGSSSLISATPDTTREFSHVAAPFVPGAAFDIGFAIPVTPLSLAATTTVYLIANASFSASTLSAWGTISARRVR